MTKVHVAVRRLVAVLISSSSLFLFSPLVAHASYPVTSSVPPAASYPLFDGAHLPCSGPTNTNIQDGLVILQSVPGGVRVTLLLQHAAPNHTYSIGVSEAPNCSGQAVYWNAFTTNQFGFGYATVFYPAAPGTHSLVINATTQNTQAQPLLNVNHHEIGRNVSPILVL